MALSRDYLSQAIVIKGNLLKDFKAGEAEVYDLVLRSIHSFDRDFISHIAHILCHLAPLTLESASAPLPAKLTAAERFISYEGLGIAVRPHPVFGGLRNLFFSPKVKSNQPSVTIIIPTKNKTEMLIPCIQTIETVTKYDNYKIIIMDNGSTRPDMIEYLSKISNPRIQVISWPHKYNWAKLNNFAVSETDSEFIVFLNDDTRILTADWLSEMVGAAMLPHAGAIGARLLYPQGHVQHIGVVASGGITGHIHKGLAPGHPGTNGLAVISHVIHSRNWRLHAYFQSSIRYHGRV